MRHIDISLAMRLREIPKPPFVLTADLLEWCFAPHDHLRDTGSPMISLARQREMAAELAPVVFCVLAPFGPETSW
jgi:hypothetical protein